MQSWPQPTRKKATTYRTICSSPLCGECDWAIYLSAFSLSLTHCPSLGHYLPCSWGVISCSGKPLGVCLAHTWAQTMTSTTYVTVVMLKPSPHSSGQAEAGDRIGWYTVIIVSLRTSSWIPGVKWRWASSERHQLVWPNTFISICWKNCCNILIFCSTRLIASIC
jgi:hypothetical protein